MARNRKRDRDRKIPQQPQHENVPGELEHASGEVEEVDASLISGAGGEPGSVDEAELAAAEAEDEAQRAAVATKGRAEREIAPRPEGNKVLNVLRASWAELQRVQWPDRRQVAQATAVVLGFVVIAGAYLGLADVVAQEIVDFII